MTKLGKAAQLSDLGDIFLSANPRKIVRSNVHQDGAGFGSFNPVSTAASKSKVETQGREARWPLVVRNVVRDAANLDLN